MKKVLMMMVLGAVVMSAQAKVRLPHLIGDNMVLQQQTEQDCEGEHFMER